MVWRALCLALFVTAAWAGCIDETTQDVPEETVTEEAMVLPETLDWGLTGCRAAVVFFDVPADAVRPFLPDGFEPIPAAIGISGAPANPTGGGSFGAEMLTCESGTALNGTVPDMIYGSLFAFVEPPADLKHDDADFHFVKWDVLVPDAPRRAVLQAYGVPALNGTAAFSSFPATAHVGSLEGTMDLGGTYGFSGSTVAAGPPEATFVEYTQVEGGLIVFKTRAVTPTSGLGSATLAVPDGSLAAEVLGAGSHDGNLMAFQGDFRDGAIWHIPRGA